jgi:hypothetical protein
VHSRLPLAWHEQLTVLGLYLSRPERLPLAWRNQRTVLSLAFADPPHSAIALIDAAVLEFGPTEILPPSARYDRATPVSPDRAPCSAPHTRGESPAFRRRRGISRETRTVRWRGLDSNHRYRVARSRFPEGFISSLPSVPRKASGVVRTNFSVGRERRAD